MGVDRPFDDCITEVFKLIGVVLVVGLIIRKVLR